MNYIAEINAFWDLAGVNPLSTGQVALWFGLMNINNRCNWTEWFSVPNQVLSIHTGLSRNGILKARNVLKQLGLIDFRERGTKATLYKMIRITKDSAISDSAQVGVQVGTATAQADATIANSAQVRVQNSVQDSAQVRVQDSGRNSVTYVKLNVNETKLNGNATYVPPASPCEEKLASGNNATQEGGGFRESEIVELAKALCCHFEENCHQMRSMPLLNAFTQSLLDGAEPDMIRAVIDETALGNVDKPALYVAAILKKLRGECVRTLSGYRERGEQHKTKGEKKNEPHEPERYTSDMLNITKL